jgi:outer membrane protein assembly factor BamA
LSPLAVLAALLFLAAPAPAAPTRPLVTEVELRLPPGVDPAPLRSLVAVRAGQPLSPDGTQRTVKALYQTGKFANVEVVVFPAEGAPAEPRVRVEVRCTPRRVAASVKVDPGAAVLRPAPCPRGPRSTPGASRRRPGPCRRCSPGTDTGRRG